MVSERTSMFFPMEIQSCYVKIDYLYLVLFANSDLFPTLHTENNCSQILDR